MLAAATPRPHDFDAGRDGVERCLVCRVTRTKQGKVIPKAALCPMTPCTSGSLDHQYKSPVEALLDDITTAASAPLMAPARLIRG